jgi:poly [ADP-ribose] polymerase
MVTGENNNKYYEMICEDGQNITINYGRIELTKTTYTKPIHEWDSIYKSKTKKGYKDVSKHVSVQVNESSGDKTPTAKIADTKVDFFMNLMKKYTDKLVSTTYSVKCDNVSQSQIDEAQSIINQLTKINKKDVSQINDKLIELYTIIPRYMSNVKNFILPNIDLEKAFVQEQDNIDAMASQVAMYNTSDKKEDKKEKGKQSLLDIMGITMKEIKANKDLDYLVKQMSGRRIESIFEVDKPAENNRFDNWLKNQKNKSTRMLIHGTRCTSVIPILEQGLKIRPNGNFQFSGKAYGDGNYFSEVVNKSMNYTGHDNDKILLVYEVHTGNPYTYNGWYNGNDFSLNYKELSKRGFDSTYVKAGNGLQNSEIIAYKEEQDRIKYIIHLKGY